MAKYYNHVHLDFNTYVYRYLGVNPNSREDVFGWVHRITWPRR